MLGMDIPIRTPTSFLFFAAAGFSTYFSREVDSLRWFAYSAFSIFLALGPAMWIESIIEELRLPKSTPHQTTWEPIEATTLVGWVFGLAQIALMGLGSYFGIQGLLHLPVPPQ